MPPKKNQRGGLSKQQDDKGFASFLQSYKLFHKGKTVADARKSWSKLEDDDKYEFVNALD